MTILKKMVEVINESNENNKVIVTDENKNIPLSFLLQETSKSLAKASNSLKLNQVKEGNMSTFIVPLVTLGGDKIQVNDKKY